MTINEEVYNKIVETLVEDFKKNKKSIKPDTLLKEDLDLDSLDKVDLIIALESAYNVEISEGDDILKKQFSQCKTVQEVSDFLSGVIIKLKEDK